MEILEFIVRILFNKHVIKWAFYMLPAFSQTIVHEFKIHWFTEFAKIYWPLSFTVFEPALSFMPIIGDLCLMIRIYA